MENVKIITDNGVEISVNGLFYVFNSKYYFIYTTGEIDENEYVKLYVVQVCKEVQNTPTGPVDTGYMLGMEISNSEEWKKVQESITKIVDDKKNETQSSEIQYLPITMVVNLKIISKNKFKLMKHIIENNFKIVLSSNVSKITDNNIVNNSIEILNNDVIPPIEQIKPIQPLEPISNNITIQNDQSIANIKEDINKESSNEVIIDYRARFFEEQEKNQALQEQINILTEKLNNIKNIIG